MPKRFIALALTVAATLCQAAALELNTATEAELDSIKGVGPATSAKFSSAGITVNGQPFAPPTLAKPQAATSQP